MAGLSVLLAVALSFAACNRGGVLPGLALDTAVTGLSSPDGIRHFGAGPLNKLASMAKAALKGELCRDGHAAGFGELDALATALCERSICRQESNQTMAEKHKGLEVRLGTAQRGVPLVN